MIRSGLVTVNQHCYPGRARVAGRIIDCLTSRCRRCMAPSTAPHFHVTRPPSHNAKTTHGALNHRVWNGNPVPPVAPTWCSWHWQPATSALTVPPHQHAHQPNIKGVFFSPQSCRDKSRTSTARRTFCATAPDPATRAALGSP